MKGGGCYLAVPAIYQGKGRSIGSKKPRPILLPLHLKLAEIQFSATRPDDGVHLRPVPDPGHRSQTTTSLRQWRPKFRPLLSLPLILRLRPLHELLCVRVLLVSVNSNDDVSNGSGVVNKQRVIRSVRSQLSRSERSERFDTDTEPGWQWHNWHCNWKRCGRRSSSIDFVSSKVIL